MTAPARPVVLCVDDDPDILEWMKLVLTARGLQAVAVAGGRQALEAVPAVRPDLIFLDLNMPGLNGLEVCAKVQELPEAANVPIVIVTGSDDRQDKARALQAGAADFLLKPLKDLAFLAKVEQHLATRRRWLEMHRSSDPAPAVSPDAALAHGRWDARLRPAEWTRFKEHLADAAKLAGEPRAAFLRCVPAELYGAGAHHSLSAKLIVDALGKYLQIPRVQNLSSDAVKLGVLPSSFCKANLIVPISDAKHAAAFVLSNPFNWEALDAVRRSAERGQTPFLQLAEPSLLEDLIAPHSRAPGKTVAMADIEAKLREEYHPDVKAELDAAANESSAPIIQLVNSLIETGYLRGASDVHIEPSEEEVVVRYRIDGDLQVINRLRPARLIQPMVARIKIMASLDISERRLPQDGRIKFKQFSTLNKDFDLRVATIPVNHGEKCVMRIIDKQKSVLPLPELGFSPRNLEIYRDRISSPYGMILHVGPTGSGKSMSLYAALNEMVSPTINIQTAEDPIEYTLPGISQTQINHDIGLSFQRALRSFLRLDPDVILVGEIRDHETAQMAIDASLTGHLLLSTLHTNDAASTIQRFLEMGIEPYMISSALLCICAQRLVRRLCKECRQPYHPDPIQRRFVGLAEDDPAVLYRAAGCERCGKTGYRGRVGIHEILAPDDALRAAINQKGITAEALKKQAVEKTGMTTLFWDAMEKVRAGLCSIDDALVNVRQDDFDSRPRWMREEARMAPAP